MEVGFTSKSLVGSEFPSYLSPFLGTQPFLPLRFERELEALRKEIAESAARTSGSDSDNLSRAGSQSDLSSLLLRTVSSHSLPNGSSSSESNGEASPPEVKKDL